MLSVCIVINSVLCHHGNETVRLKPCCDHIVTLGFTEADRKVQPLPLRHADAIGQIYKATQRDIEVIELTCIAVFHTFESTHTFHSSSHNK